MSVFDIHHVEFPNLGWEFDLSRGFEIETEMSIHAIDKNMFVENVVIEYRDRPEGSESKLNTYSDGMKVLFTMVKLYKNYKPLGFFTL